MNSPGEPHAGDFVRRAEAHWKLKGGHFTIVRKWICGEIERRKGDFTALSLWQSVQREDPGISLASVYRTLSGLAGAGLIRELPTSGGDQRLFTLGSSDDLPVSSFVVCVVCGATFPLDGAEGTITRLHEEQARNLGFRPESVTLSIRARCPACLDAR